MDNDPGSGSTWRTQFAFFDRDSSSWRTSQLSLLEESGESCTTWPKQGMWDLGSAYELPTSELLIAEIESSSSRALPTPTGRDWKGRNQRDDDSCLPGAVALLPTPMAYETDPGPEMVDEIRDKIDHDDPHHRLYLEGRKWFTQRTLSRIAPALLPTPSANDSTGAELETREARQEDGSTGGPSLRDLPKLLPTPMTDPAAGNGPGRGVLSSEAKKLLPTPVANPDNPGAGGELRAALTHGEGRRNETGIDTMGRPNKGRPSRLLPTPMANQGRAQKDWDPDSYSASGRSLPTVAKAAGEQKLLPTPTSQAAKHGSTEDVNANGHGFNLWDVPHQIARGESTEKPSEDGSSSPDQPPHQLTIGDA